MVFGIDLGTLVLMIAGALVVFLVIDLLATGGSACAAMAGGTAGMMSTPWGWGAVLLAVLVALVLWFAGSPGG